MNRHTKSSKINYMTSGQLFRLFPLIFYNVTLIIEFFCSFACHETLPISNLMTGYINNKFRFLLPFSFSVNRPLFGCKNSLELDTYYLYCVINVFLFDFVINVQSISVGKM